MKSSLEMARYYVSKGDIVDSVSNIIDHLEAQLANVLKEHNEYEQTIGEVFEVLEDRGLIRAGTKLADDVLRVIGERDDLQDAIAEQMAENGRLAARVEKLEAPPHNETMSLVQFVRQLDVARDAYEFAVEELKAEADFSEQLKEQVVSARKKNTKLSEELRNKTMMADWYASRFSVGLLEKP